MPTISQRIALEGAEEIRRQLQALGKAGTASFEQIEAAGIKAAQGLDRVVNSVARVERSFVALNASARAFGSSLSNAGQAFGSFEGAILRSVRNIGLLTAAVGGAAAGFVALVKNAADAADNIGEQAAGLGITTDVFQGLTAAASDSGIGVEQFGRGLANLGKIAKEDAEKALKDAAQHVANLGLRFPRTTAGAAAFADMVGRTASRLQAFVTSTGQGETVLGRLGVRTLDVAGNMRGVDDIFFDVADAVAKLPPGLEKTTLANELFSARFGRRFIDMLDKGSEGIKALAAQFTALKFTTEDFKVGDEFARQFGVLDLIMTRARQKLFLLFGPSFTDLMGAFTETLLSNFERVHAGLRNVVDQGIKPIIEDLIRLLRGEPVQTQWVADLGSKFNRLGQIISEAVRIIGVAFAALRAGAAGIAGAINSIFGTNVSGDALLVAAAILKVTGVLSLFISGLALAGAAGLLFVRTIALVGSGLRLLAVALAAFGVINPFGAVIAALLVLVLVFSTSSDEIKRIWEQLWASLGPIATKAIADAFGEITLESAFVAIFNDFAKFGEGLVANAKILGLKIAQGITSGLALLPTFLGGDVFAGLSESFGKAIANIQKQAEEGGRKIGGALGNATAEQFADDIKQPVESAWEIIKRTFIEGMAGLGIKVDTAKLDEATGKVSSLNDQLKRMGITADSMKGKFGQLGQAGSLAFNSIKEAAEDAAAKIREINAQATSSQADLRDDARALQRERQKIVESGGDTEEIDEKILINQRKLIAAEDQRRAKIEAITEAEQKNVDAIKAQNAELALQQRLRDSAASAAQSQFAPLGGGPAAPGALPPGAIDTTAINAALTQLGTVVQEATTKLQSLVAIDFAAFATTIQEIIDVIVGLGADLDLLADATAGLGADLDLLADAAAGAAQALDNIEAGGGGDLTELAGGGMIRGPGTSTSDSIIARLSRGEYVVRAAAVRHYGPALLSAINGLRIPRPTGFNLGGLVDGMQRSLSALMIPRFAQGGLADMSLVGGGRPIALTINAGGERQTFHVWADEQVADSVVRYATKRQVASAGRKSGAFG